MARGDRAGGAGRQTGKPARGSFGRRTPPPESTGAEVHFLAEHKEKGTPLRFVMADGHAVEGVIEYYDREMIKVTRAEGANLFIRKSEIRAIEEEHDDADD